MEDKSMQSSRTASGSAGRLRVDCGGAPVGCVSADTRLQELLHGCKALPMARLTSTSLLVHRGDHTPPPDLIKVLNK